MAKVDEDVEIRGFLPRDTVNVLDAVVQATPGTSRIGLMQDILAAWASRKKHEAMMICRVTRSNGCAPETGRKGIPVASGPRNPSDALSLVDDQDA